MIPMIAKLQVALNEHDSMEEEEENEGDDMDIATDEEVIQNEMVRESSKKRNRICNIVGDTPDPNHCKGSSSKGSHSYRVSAE